ncbi:hypothetical protein [Nocardiopsis suaedae]|uniref:Transposase n=1 Tax=Nocardiopsis suaedae TaxID=3018444 RepID=A0ABT4TFS4_9ACTN|nr:hypothetical protein [Nocardiopsis suaedae]MDA2803534.1 hypothetical protein [Nocardiopsis suaedae]
MPETDFPTRTADRLAGLFPDGDTVEAVAIAKGLIESALTEAAKELPGER